MVSLDWGGGGGGESRVELAKNYWLSAKVISDWLYSTLLPLPPFQSKLVVKDLKCYLSMFIMAITNIEASK